MADDRMPSNHEVASLHFANAVYLALEERLPGLLERAEEIARASTQLNVGAERALLAIVQHLKGRAERS